MLRNWNQVGRYRGIKAFLLWEAVGKAKLILRLLASLSWGGLVCWLDLNLLVFEKEDVGDFVSP